MTYFATPGQVSMGVELLIGTPVMPKNLFPQKTYLAMSKCMVPIATHNTLFVCLFVFVALHPMSTAMVIAGRSVH